MSTGTAEYDYIGMKDAGRGNPTRRYGRVSLTPMIPAAAGIVLRKERRRLCAV